MKKVLASFLTAASLAALLEKLGHQCCPTGLMTGAEPRTIVAVEVLVEQNQIAPVRIMGVNRVCAMDGPFAHGRFQKDTRQAARQLRRDFPKCAVDARSGGALDSEFGPVIMVEFLQRFDQQEVGGEPDRTAPVGVASEQIGRRFSR